MRIPLVLRYCLLHRCVWCSLHAQLIGIYSSNQNETFLGTTTVLLPWQQAVWLEILIVTRTIGGWNFKLSLKYTSSVTVNMLRGKLRGTAWWQWLELIERSTLTKNFIFVPGHAGVGGNEHACRLAGIATVGLGWAMDRVDILDVFRKAEQKKDVSNDFEFASMNRLQECLVKSGVARQEHFASSQKWQINQCRVAVVSLNKQLDVLRRKSE